MTDKPRIENAPGIVWRRKGDGWEAMWRARADLVKAGFTPKNHPLWFGIQPSATDAAAMADTCRRLQDEMLIYGRGGVPIINGFDGTIKSLMNCYQTDPDSTYHRKRYAVRKNHDITYRKMVLRHGHEELSGINARVILGWHKEWSDGGVKIAMAHGFIGHLRTLFAFGATILEDADCDRLCGVLHKMRFQSPKPRTERLTADQAVLIRNVAREKFQWHSIALAQALQFDLMLRQKDVIGEWVPRHEPGISDITKGTDKWIRGLRWSEIDDKLILRHTTSKRDKDLELDLKLAPMVLEELELSAEMKSDKGALVICEATGLPFTTAEFRRKWRIVADAAGIPKSVRNMDSRAGAISEATDAGADLEHVRHAATHSNIAMTQRYSRGATDKIAGVMRTRSEHRNKPKTGSGQNE